jgi:hypothetical protein
MTGRGMRWLLAVACLVALACPGLATTEVLHARAGARLHCEPGIAHRKYKIGFLKLLSPVRLLAGRKLSVVATAVAKSSNGGRAVAAASSEGAQAVSQSVATADAGAAATAAANAQAIGTGMAFAGMAPSCPLHGDRPPRTQRCALVCCTLRHP